MKVIIPHYPLLFSLNLNEISKHNKYSLEKNFSRASYFRASLAFWLTKYIKTPLKFSKNSTSKLKSITKVTS